MSDKNKVTIEFENKMQMIFFFIGIGFAFNVLMNIVIKLFSFLTLSEYVEVTIVGILLICLGLYGIVRKKIIFYDKTSSKVFSAFVNGLIIMFGISYIFMINI